MQNAQLEVEKYKENAKQYQNDIVKLKAELEVEKEQNERIMAESTEIEATWANYNKTQAAYEKTLKNQIKQVLFYKNIKNINNINNEKEWMCQ